MKVPRVFESGQSLLRRLHERRPHDARTRARTLAYMLINARPGQFCIISSQTHKWNTLVRTFDMLVTIFDMLVNIITSL